MTRRDVEQLRRRAARRAPALVPVADRRERDGEPSGHSLLRLPEPVAVRMEVGCTCRDVELNVFEPPDGRAFLAARDEDRTYIDTLDGGRALAALDGDHLGRGSE